MSTPAKAAEGAFLVAELEKSEIADDPVHALVDGTVQVFRRRVNEPHAIGRRLRAGKLEHLIGNVDGENGTCVLELFRDGGSGGPGTASEIDNAHTGTKGGQFDQRSAGLAIQRVAGAEAVKGSRVEIPQRLHLSGAGHTLLPDSDDAAFQKFAQEMLDAMQKLFPFAGRC